MSLHVPFVSAEQPIQADRILRIETPLGLDVLLPERFELTEGIGGFGGDRERLIEAGLFTGRIAVRSPRHDIAANEIVGKMVDVSVELSAEPPVRRSWHCLVSELLVGPPVTRGMRSYRLTVRPAHWLMTRRKDCRIWQNQSSIDVARTLLSEHGLAAPVTDGVITPPPPQAYSVQFNESDWAFMCRRLEQDGCAWWVRHEGGTIGSVAATTRLHIASYVSGYTESDYDDGRIRYAAGSTDRNHITRFDTAFSFVPGARSGADWNFLTPSTVPGADTTIPSLVDLPGGALGSNHSYESFEYPSVGGYGTGEGADGASEGIDEAELDRLARLRAQAHEADHARVEGEGTVRTLAPGQKFTPYDVPAELGLSDLLLGSAAGGDTSFDEHVVLSITHRAVDQSYESQGGAPEYGCTFSALPAKTPATPHRRTSRPRIDGQQIAVIAGPEGEEIHTDRFGRVKLWFPWDRRAQKDGTDTCWVRVAQSWAGSGWGAQVIPRIGMEAVISYLDGDPDRPLVTGLAPNPRQKVPYELPAHKTKSVFRTNTHKGGSWKRMNELTFDDALGREEVFIHAERDRTEKTNNNHTQRIDNNYFSSVGRNSLHSVRNNSESVVGGNFHMTIGGTSSTEQVSFADRTSIFGLKDMGYNLQSPYETFQSSGHYVIECSSNSYFSVGGNQSTTVVGKCYSNIGGDSFAVISGDRTVQTAGDDRRTTSGDSIENVGGRKTALSNETMRLRVGDSQIVLEPDGTIVIEAENVRIDGRQSIQMKSPRIDLN